MNEHIELLRESAGVLARNAWKAFNVGAELGKG